MEQKAKSLLQHERVQSILRKVPLVLKNFPPEDYRAFLMTGELELYLAGQIILSEASEKISEAWLPTEGRLSIWKDDIEVAQLGPGDFFGETFLFSKGSRIATVRAETDVAMIRFDRNRVLHFFRTRPERLFKIFIMNIIEIQQKKLAATNMKVVRLQRRLMELQTT